MTSTNVAAPAATIKASRCDRPACYALILGRPLRCPHCGNTRLVYVEARDGKQVRR